MKNYKIGEYYNFRVKGLGNHRIYLEDENGDSFSVYAYDFQTEWDWSSPQVPVEVLKCYVKDISASGQLILEQSKDILLIVFYQDALNEIESICNFIVEDLKTINGILYYVITDAFGIRHMYKPRSQQAALQPGEDISLKVKSIKYKENNKSYLVFEEITTSIPTPDSNTSAQIMSDDDTPVGEFGEETDRIEFKSTIVYPAGAVAADIDTQMRVILRTIAGFMNANGGTLYIGVNDNGDAVGIEKEYCLLNSSIKDKQVYQQNKDGYENKLRSGMNALLGPVAQDYVKIKFSEHNNHTVCAIEIEPSDNVIWYDEREAYKRMGNRTTHLRSDAIIKLCFDKAKLTKPAALQVQPKPIQSEDEILPDVVIADSAPETEPAVIKISKPASIKFIGEEKQGNGSFYMNMFTNGDWSWSKSIPSDADLEFCIPINSPASKNDLIMVYDDGCVNRVDAYHLHLDKKEDKRYMNGRRNDGVALVKVFHAKEDDLLACFCKQNGQEFVKVHPVLHVSQHDNMSLKGNRVINTTGIEGLTDARICFVSAEHDNRVSALKKTENQLSNSIGFDMSLKKNAKFLQVKATLETLCDVPA